MPEPKYKYFNFSIDRFFPEGDTVGERLTQLKLTIDEHYNLLKRLDMLDAKIESAGFFAEPFDERGYSQHKATVFQAKICKEI